MQKLAAVEAPDRPTWAYELNEVSSSDLHWRKPAEDSGCPTWSTS
ncbi:hypothetical protein [Botrimarina hoheduenensis]|nr:hypothetical protein [Botrimarina hoheduenensis]